MDQPVERRLITLAQRQHQVVTLQQVIQLGIPKTTFYRMVRRGWWTQKHRGVYLRAGTEETPFQEAIAAVFACGPQAFASRRTAGRVWGFEIPAPDRPEVTVLIDRRLSPNGVLVHRTRRTRPTDFTTFHRVPLSTPMRTLLELSPLVSERELEVALDYAHRRALVSIESLAAYLAHVGNRSLPGSRVLRAIVALRDPRRPLGSDLESELFHLLRTVGLPLPIPQHWVDTRKGPRRIDFAYPERGIAIEADGYEYHSGLGAFDDDRIRQNEVEELGWTFRRFTWSHVREHPMEVVTTFAIALGVLPTRWKPRETGRPSWG